MNLVLFLSAVGMLEYLKTGILGSGEMGKWVVWGIPFDMRAKNVHKFRSSLLKINANIPLFHSSIIPSLRQHQLTSTAPLIFVTRRKFDTYNYNGSIVFEKGKCYL